MVPLLVNSHDGNEVDDFRMITLLNTNLKIWARIQTIRLKSAVDILIGHEESYALKRKTLLDNLHLVRNIVNEINDGTSAPLVSLDQSKDFDRMDHNFLEATPVAAVFGDGFRPCIRHLYQSPSERLKVEVVEYHKVCKARLPAISTAPWPRAGTLPP